MSVHENKRLWQRHVLAENRRSIEGLLETLSAEPVYEVMATGAAHRGREAVAAFYKNLFESMPDVTFNLMDVFVAENGVVEESVLVGTHTGDLQSPGGTIPASGKTLNLRFMDYFKVVSGKILDHQTIFDQVEMLTQLGAMPGA